MVRTLIVGTILYGVLSMSAFAGAMLFEVPDRMSLLAVGLVFGLGAVAGSPYGELIDSGDKGFRR